MFSLIILYRKDFTCITFALVGITHPYISTSIRKIQLYIILLLFVINFYEIIVIKKQFRYKYSVSLILAQTVPGTACLVPAFYNFYIYICSGYNSFFACKLRCFRLKRPYSRYCLDHKTGWFIFARSCSIR